MTACVFWSTFDEAAHTAKQGMKMVRHSFTNKKGFEFTPYERSSMSVSRGTNLSAGASITDVESAAENKGGTEGEGQENESLGGGHRRNKSVYEARPNLEVSKEPGGVSLMSFVTTRLTRMVKSSQPSASAVVAVAAPEDEGGPEKEPREVEIETTNTNTNTSTSSQS